uniref:Peptidase S8/S53 domain-containing protein n=1 Tax=Panagrolaimus davidi TaxID=227884 RepID=A0A914PL97_9BILA
MYSEKFVPKDFIPKKDVQQDIFLKKNPNYDGRGILMAIIDTAVDVNLPGLQKTSTGLPKIIDCFDFTGNGDVDTSKVKRIGTDGCLIGLSGRKMRIPKSWKNPSGKWHLGITSILDECYNTVLDSIKIKDKNSAQILEYNQPKTIESKKAWKKIEIKTYPELLSKDLATDCIVWNNGEKWQACLISAENFKNLENIKILSNFRDEHEYCFLSYEIPCCITIQSNGNLLNLFIPFNSHGSSVAQVAARHFPVELEKDGLAPGAQIVSMKVCEKLTDFIKAKTSFEKALSKCIELGVDIINFSLGGGVFCENTIVDLIKKAVKEKGIMITMSASNSGPFISSLKNFTTHIDQEILIIGSINTSDTNSIFGEKIDDPPTVTFYSSRGPLPNGARGITFGVPSSAVIENPGWYTRKKQIFEGTSCASPIAAGAITCLLSALKANSMKYTPATIKMALCNTAFLPKNGDRLISKFHGF